MALISCNECGKQISDKAKACPECGCPVEVETANSTNISLEGPVQNDMKPIKYDWSWPAFLFVGLWALYKKLWSKFFVAVAVNTASTVIYKICYPIIMIMLADKIDNPNTFIVISLLIFIAFMLVPTVIVAAWFGKNGNKWISSNTACSSSSQPTDNIDNSHKYGDHKRTLFATRHLFAKKSTYVIITILAVTSFEYIIYRNSVKEYLSRNYDAAKYYSTNKLSVIHDYFKYNIVERCLLNSQERKIVDNLSKRILYVCSSKEVNEFNSRMTMADIIKKYNIRKYIHNAKAVNYDWIRADGIKFFNDDTGDLIFIVQANVTIFKPDNSAYHLYFDNHVLTFDGGIISTPKLTSVRYTYNLEKNYNKIGHAVYAQIVNKFDELDLKRESRSYYFNTHYSFDDSGIGKAYVAYDDNDVYAKVPTITWELKL